MRAGWDKLVVGVLSIAQHVDPFQSDLAMGETIPAIDAVNWSVGNRNCDIRPRLLDKSTGKSRLIDSGSQISITAKEPGDKIDNSFRLVAVNGSKIDTYGVKEITIKIGRKTYLMPAVVCDIQQDILGMDFISRYKLNLEWDEFDQTELLIVDKKAQIRAPLTIVTVPTDIPRVHYLDSMGAKPPELLTGRQIVGPPKEVDNDIIEFQVACMKALDQSENKVKKGYNREKMNEGFKD